MGLTIALLPSFEGSKTEAVHVVQGAKKICEILEKVNLLEKAAFPSSWEQVLLNF